LYTGQFIDDRFLREFAEIRTFLCSARLQISMNLLIAIFGAWFANQILKIIISRDASMFFNVGGMPSSHAALAGAAASAIALQTGFASAPAAVSYVLLCFTIHHAVHQRKHHTMTETIVGAIVGIIGAALLTYW
jgi:acid phosphatase family membrane protein YuiD